MIHYEKLLEIAPEWRNRLPAEKLRQAADQIFTPDGFFEWPEARRMMVRVPAEISKEDFADLRQNVFVLARYLASGERVFRVEPGLARLLLDTGLPKITGEEFALPFPAIYLEFPPKFFECPGMQRPPIGCYLLDMRPFAQVTSCDFVLEPRVEELPGAREFVLHVNIGTAPGKSVEWGDLVDPFARSLKTSRERLFVRTMAAFANEMARFVVNAVLYATSALPEITEVVSEWRQAQKTLGSVKPKRRQKLLDRLRRLPRTQKYKLGKSIPVMYGAPKATDFSEEARQARRILKRFLVRAHWRWQAHGPARALRKHILIAPFWKGPRDLAEMLARKYQLK